MIKKMIKKFILYINSNLTILIKRYSERKKFKDPRRKKIYNSVYLDSDTKREIDDLYIKNYGKKFRIFGISTLQLLLVILINTIFQNYYIFQNLNIL